MAPLSSTHGRDDETREDARERAPMTTGRPDTAVRSIGTSRAVSGPVSVPSRGGTRRVMADNPDRKNARSRTAIGPNSQAKRNPLQPLPRTGRLVSFNPLVTDLVRRSQSMPRRVPRTDRARRDMHVASYSAAGIAGLLTNRWTPDHDTSSALPREQPLRSARTSRRVRRGRSARRWWAWRSSS